MDSVVGFHLQDKDGKLFLIIDQPQTQSSTSSVQAELHDHRLHQPLFLCPRARREKDRRPGVEFPLTSSYKYVPSQDQTSTNHHVLPLFWCSNKEFDSHDQCDICRGPNFITDYYFCEFCGSKYHKECVESPLKIKHPYHPHHPLQLFFSWAAIHECFCCGISRCDLMYRCSICNIFMHSICAMQPIPFLIKKPKRHDHPLSFFTRKDSLTCNICGLLRKIYPTYVCLRCNFVAHNDCMSSPSIIMISRHHHRISYTSSLPSKEYSCGVCRQNIDGDYGAYTCGKCSDYAVHSRCALKSDVWDREELEGVPERDDMIQVEPFKKISQGVILHFLHGHRLFLEVNMLYDEKKLCQACALPIYEGYLYSCHKCDFILHEPCANAPRVIQHGIHPHPLVLKDISRINDIYYGLMCRACHRYCDGFGYRCQVNGCEDFALDVRCALISEPFDFKGHEHALFLALNPESKPICQVCKEKSIPPLNCIKCDFIICFKCASLPYKVRSTHDEHSLTFSWGEEACEEDWCEVCECNIKDFRKPFYSCKECCTFLHNACLLGPQPYLKWRPK